MSIEKILNFLGNAKGYGCCEHCGGTWNRKEPFQVKYSEGRYGFAVCTDCAKVLSEEEILKYQMLVWVKHNHGIVVHVRAIGGPSYPSDSAIKAFPMEVARTSIKEGLSGVRKNFGEAQ